MAQYGRPNADIETSGWTSTPLYEKIDETTYSDTDYIQSTSGSGTYNCTVGISTLTDPAASSGHILRWRSARLGSGNNTINTRLYLYQGATLKATTGQFSDGASYVEHSYTLSSAEADSISNYADLQVIIEAVVAGAGSQYSRVSWVELEVPSGGPQNIDESVSLGRTLNLSASSALNLQSSASLSLTKAITAYAPSAAEGIIDIDHESGDLSQYTSTVTDGGNLSASSAAALGETNYGLSVTLGNTNQKYGQKSITANTSSVFRARIYFDPNGFTATSTGIFYLLSMNDIGGSYSFGYIHARYNAGTYEVRATMVDDAPQNVSTSYYAITNEPHYIEVRWQRAEGPMELNGSLELWIDGVSKEQMLSIASYDRWGSGLSAVQLGMCYTTATGPSGTYYLDELVVNDTGTEIGPIGQSNTVNESVSLGKENVLAAAAERPTINESTSLGKSAAATSQALANTQAATSLSKLGTVTVQEEVITGAIEESVSLGRILYTYKLPYGTYSESVSLGKSLAQTAVSNLSAQSPTSLARSESLSDASSLSAQAAAALGTSRTIAPAGGLSAQSPATLTRQEALESTSTTNVESAANLARSETFNAESATETAPIEESITLSRGLSCTQPWGAPEIEESISLDKTDQLGSASNLVAGSSTSLAKSSALDAQANLNSQAAATLARTETFGVLEETQAEKYETASLAKSTGLTAAESLNAQSSLNLGKTNSLTVLEETQGAKEEAISLGRAEQLSAQSSARVQSAASLARTESLSDSANASVQAPLSLGRQEALLAPNGDGQTINESISLGRTETFSDSGLLRAQSATTFSRRPAFSPSATLSVPVGTTLGRRESLAGVCLLRAACPVTFSRLESAYITIDGEFAVLDFIYFTLEMSTRPTYSLDMIRSQTRSLETSTRPTYELELERDGEFTLELTRTSSAGVDL